MTRIHTIIILTALCGCSTVAACDRTPAEAHSDAIDTEQKAARDIKDNNEQAQKTIDNAQNEAAKAVATSTQHANAAMDGANKKIAEAKQDALHDNAEVQAKANAKIREANVEVVDDKLEVRTWGQEKIDALNNKIDDARVKSQRASVKAKASFEAGMAQVQEKRDKLATELTSVASRDAKQAATFKTRMGSEVDRLETRVAQLERAL